MNKAVFLDRDGVINDMLFDETGYMHSPRRIEDFKIKDGVAEFVKRAKELGYLVIVITSQPEIRRGLVDKKTVTKMHDALKSELAVDDIFVCFHDDVDNCDCRKPKPGMLSDASKKWDIDLKNSFVIGDTWKDVGAGEAVGCTTVLVDAEYNRKAEADIRVGSLGDILQHIGHL